MFVRRQLENIDPRVLCALTGDVNFDDLVDKVQIQLFRRDIYLGADDEDERLQRAKRDEIEKVAVSALSGVGRGACLYSYVYPAIGKWQGLVVDCEPENEFVTESFEKYLAVVGLNSVRHLADLVRTIRTFIEPHVIDRFMIGKASHPVTRKHAHCGMVNRFRKYELNGYSSMVGLLFLHGGKVKQAEALILQLEAVLHGIFRDLYPFKFDSFISSASTGSLVDDKKGKHYFTLYLALHHRY